MKRFVTVSTLVGFCVPIWWGVMCFLTFTGPQSPTADMFWEVIHRTCPPCTIESPILGSMFATPFLNALLYGGVAARLAVPLGVAGFCQIRREHRIGGTLAMTYDAFQRCGQCQ